MLPYIYLNYTFRYRIVSMGMHEQCSELDVKSCFQAEELGHVLITGISPSSYGISLTTELRIVGKPLK